MKQTTNMARVIGEIQSIARKVNERWFNNELDMSRVIFVVFSNPRTYGHFTPYLSYRVHDKDGEHGAVEINISAGTLDRPIENCITTLIHEMVHYYCYCKGIKEVSRNGQYHNSRFRTEAEQRGIICEYDSKIGWSISSPSEQLISWIIECGFEDFRLGRNDYESISISGPKAGNRNTDGTPTKVKKGNSIKMVCPTCKNIARVTKTTHLICGDCMLDMIEA